MAKFTKNIERMIADLRNDEKVQAMHRDNINRAVARRARRAELCRLFLAAYCYRKNGGAVIGYDDREAKKAAIRRGIVQKFNGDVGKAIRFYSAVGKEDNQEFNRLFYEVVRELQEEQENDLHEWCESKAEKLARLTGEDKAAIVDRLEGRTNDQENKRPTLSLNRAASKRENKIITVGNKKAYQVGKGDYKHRNGVIIEN